MIVISQIVPNIHCLVASFLMKSVLLQRLVEPPINLCFIYCPVKLLFSSIRDKKSSEFRKFSNYQKLKRKILHLHSLFCCKLSL